MSRAVFTCVGALAVVGLTVGCESREASPSPTAPASMGSEQQGAGAKPDNASHGNSGGGAEMYMAKLDPLNVEVSYRKVNGTARFQILKGTFTAAVNATGLHPGMIHPQHIHAAAACPPPSADVNGDGFIDVLEGVPFYGPILIPLDSDLSSQAAGSFPFVDNRGGSLQYRESTTMAALLADLNAADPNPADAVVKLNGAPLNLESRHVVVHGVALDTPLPASVASIGGLPPQLTLPVACGEIRRVN